MPSPSVPTERVPRHYLLAVPLALAAAASASDPALDYPETLSVSQCLMACIHLGRSARIYQSQDFTKTGSGRTKAKLRKKTAILSRAS